MYAPCATPGLFFFFFFYLEGKELEFKVIKLDQRRNNVVVSRRAVVESEYSEEREKLLANLQEGQTVMGIVKNLTDYGAFLDLGGIDGLLHITDMAWKRVKHPSEVVEVGQEMQIKVLKFDRERNRVSLGLKQLGEDPWVDLVRRYPEHSRIFGKVTNIADYGCFVEIEEGVEGLVHVSEMDWTNRNVNPNKVVALGDEVEVMILDIDQERRRISLGIKQCKQNPWDDFSETFKKGDRVTRYDQVDHRLRHLHRPGRRYRRPDPPVRPVLERGRRPGGAQLQEGRRDRCGGAGRGPRARAHLAGRQADRPRPVRPVGGRQPARHASSPVPIKELEQRHAVIELGDGVRGACCAPTRSIESASRTCVRSLKIGDEVEAKFVGQDRKSRMLSVSIKAKDYEEESEAMKEFEQGNEEAAPSTLGDLLKEQLAARDKAE